MDFKVNNAARDSNDLIMPNLSPRPTEITSRLRSLWR